MFLVFILTELVVAARTQKIPAINVKVKVGAKKKVFSRSDTDTANAVIPIIII